MPGSGQPRKERFTLTQWTKRSTSTLMWTHAVRGKTRVSPRSLLSPAFPSRTVCPVSFGCDATCCFIKFCHHSCLNLDFNFKFVASYDQLVLQDPSGDIFDEMQVEATGNGGADAAPAEGTPTIAKTPSFVLIGFQCFMCVCEVVEACKLEVSWMDWFIVACSVILFAWLWSGRGQLNELPFQRPARQFHLFSSWGRTSWSWARRLTLLKLSRLAFWVELEHCKPCAFGLNMWGHDMLCVCLFRKNWTSMLLQMLKRRSCLPVIQVVQIIWSSSFMDCICVHSGFLRASMTLWRSCKQSTRRWRRCREILWPRHLPGWLVRTYHVNLAYHCLEIVLRVLFAFGFWLLKLVFHVRDVFWTAGTMLRHSKSILFFAPKKIPWWMCGSFVQGPLLEWVNWEYANDHYFLHGFSWCREWCFVAGSGDHQRQMNNDLRRKRRPRRRGDGKKRRMVSKPNDSGLHNFPVPVLFTWCDVDFDFVEEWLGFWYGMSWKIIHDLILASLKGACVSLSLSSSDVSTQPTANRWRLALGEKNTCQHLTLIDWHFLVCMCLLWNLLIWFSLIFHLSGIDLEAESYGLVPPVPGIWKSIAICSFGFAFIVLKSFLNTLNRSGINTTSWVQGLPREAPFGIAPTFWGWSFVAQEQISTWTVDALVPFSCAAEQSLNLFKHPLRLIVPGHLAVCVCVFFMLLNNYDLWYWHLTNNLGQELCVCSPHDWRSLLARWKLGALTCVDTMWHPLGN